MDLTEEYERRRTEYLVPIAQKLQEFFESKVQSRLERVDRISARAKDTKRFIEKASKEVDGHKKYEDPLNEIMDQIGVRIVTFYTQDVEIASATVLKYFNEIERKTLEPEGEDQFGYVGKHFILPLPSDVTGDLPEDEIPEHFELQIKTMFQHAWAEVNHDVAYKPRFGALDREQIRLVAYAAAQAWGADRIFSEIAAGRIFENLRIVE